MLPEQSCPECEHGPQFGRRDFIRVLGASAVAAAVPMSPLAQARAARAEKQAKAEQLVFELFSTMDSDQKKKLVFPWAHVRTDAKGKAEPLPARLMTGNAAVKGSGIGDEYNKKQVELLDRIFRSIANGDEGYHALSRNKTFDASGSFENIGAQIFGEAVEGKKFSLVFTGHHITVRCDGNSEDKTAFGGPLYYGHTPSGYAKTNVFHAQTDAAMGVFDSLTEEQKKSAVLGNRGWQDGVGSVKLPGKDAKKPGLAYADMSKEQTAAIEKLMKQLVSPYRKEDGDEVMEIIKANGGFEKLSLAFYTDKETEQAKKQWSYWRLEGPGFVWSYRALPHIHTFVNISANLA